MTAKGICKDFGILARVHLKRGVNGNLHARAGKVEGQLAGYATDGRRPYRSLRVYAVVLLPPARAEQDCVIATNNTRPSNLLNGKPQMLQV